MKNEIWTMWVSSYFHDSRYGLFLLWEKTVFDRHATNNIIKSYAAKLGLSLPKSLFVRLFNCWVASCFTPIKCPSCWPRTMSSVWIYLVMPVCWKLTINKVIIGFSLGLKKNVNFGFCPNLLRLPGRSELWTPYFFYLGQRRVAC